MKGAKSTHKLHRDCEVMGARLEAVLGGEDVGHLDAVAVRELIVRFDGRLARFKPGSELARVNQEAGRGIGPSQSVKAFFMQRYAR